jgi:hypothetical protein
VRSGLTFRGSILSQHVGTPRVLLAYFGTSDALIEASFDGTLVAPRAKAVLSSATHSGGFFARELEVQAAARIEPSPLAAPWEPSTLSP